MKPPLKVVEVDRRARDIRAESAHSRDERNRLTQQLRAALGQKKRAFDQGFAAAIEMLERGATIERLREMVRPDGAVLARGTRDFDRDAIPNETDETPTEPISLTEKL